MPDYDWVNLSGIHVCTINVPLVDESIEITVQDDEVTDHHNDFCDEIIEFLENNFQSIESEIFKYLIDEFDAHLESVWDCCSTPSIKIPESSRRLFSFQVECSYDEEHGIAVGIRDGNILGVGEQGRW